MLIRVPGQPGKDLCDGHLGVTRRDVLRVGGSSMLGATLGGMLQMQAASAAAPTGAAWTRALDDRTKRGTLHDQYQFVRGDTGRWNDEAQLQRAPPLDQKPARMPLDDWFEQALTKKLPAAS